MMLTHEEHKTWMEELPLCALECEFNHKFHEWRRIIWIKILRILLRKSNHHIKCAIDYEQIPSSRSAWQQNKMCTYCSVTVMFCCPLNQVVNMYMVISRLNKCNDHSNVFSDHFLKDSFHIEHLWDPQVLGTFSITPSLYGWMVY